MKKKKKKWSTHRESCEHWELRIAQPFSKQKKQQNKNYIHYELYENCCNVFAIYHGFAMPNAEVHLKIFSFSMDFVGLFANAWLLAFYVITMAVKYFKYFLIYVPSPSSPLRSAIRSNHKNPFRRFENVSCRAMQQKMHISRLKKHSIEHWNRRTKKDIMPIRRALTIFNAKCTKTYGEVN